MKNDLGNISMIISIHFIFTVGNIPFDSIFAFYDPCLTFDATMKLNIIKIIILNYIGIANLLK